MCQNLNMQMSWTHSCVTTLPGTVHDENASASGPPLTSRLGFLMIIGPIGRINQSTKVVVKNAHLMG